MSDKKRSETHYLIQKLNHKFETLSRYPIICLTIIGLVGILIRLYYFPYTIPLTLDALGYFWYAMDMSVLGQFPKGYIFPNNGWPTFLSVFFFVNNSENFLDYMLIQRYLSIIISVLTIIPVYLLCRRFFTNTYSLIGATIFVFEPRLIINSLNGTPEPLYILLVTISLFLFLSSNVKSIYAAFGVTALLTLVRYEGFLLMFPISIMFFARFRHDKKVIQKYLVALFIFWLILLPMMYVRMETSSFGADGVISHAVIAGPTYYLNVSQNAGQEIIIDFLYKAVTNFVQYAGWIMIPYFVFFVPFGILMLFRNREYKKTTIIIYGIAFLLPALYAYSRGIQDTKYFYVMYPMLSILSIYTIMRLNVKFQKQKSLGILLIGFILSSSLLFLYNKNFDYEHEIQAFKISEHIANIAEGINDYSPEDKYLAVSKLSERKFPLQNFGLSSRYCWVLDTERCSAEELEILKEKPGMEFYSDPAGPRTFSTDRFNSLVDFINNGRKEGLTHIVIDENPNRPDFLKDVLLHEYKYPFLKKEYDSLEHGYTYHVKIYKIDYDKFDSIN